MHYCKKQTHTHKKVGTIKKKSTLVYIIIIMEPLSSAGLSMYSGHHMDATSHTSGILKGYMHVMYLYVRIMDPAGRLRWVLLRIYIYTHPGRVYDTCIHALTTTHARVPS